MTRSVLLTGASGFIGRRCIAPLLHAGFDVHAVSLRRQPDVGERVYWHSVNLLDSVAIGSWMRTVRPTHLLHAAWIATPGTFWTSEENLGWLGSSMELVRQFYASGGQRVVGVGSCAEYEWNSTDCDELRTPVRPATIYGRSKAAMSFALEAASAAAERTAAWARIFFPYGPGDAQQRFIPTVIRGLLKGEPIECTHGNQVRDFIFVDDVADALVTLVTGEVTGAYNVGTGQGVTLRAVAATICAKLGGAELVKFGARPAPPAEPARIVADMTRMKKETGWKADCGIEAGIDRAIAALRDTPT